MNVWNRLPCSAVLHVTPSVDNFHNFAMPAIMVMQPLYGAGLISFSDEGDVSALFVYFLYYYCKQWYFTHK